MNNRWRTIDIVIASIIAVAFGVIFWAWGLLWNGPADAIPLPGRAVIYGVWLVPAVLGVRLQLPEPPDSVMLQDAPAPLTATVPVGVPWLPETVAVIDALPPITIDDGVAPRVTLAPPPDTLCE